MLAEGTGRASPRSFLTAALKPNGFSDLGHPLEPCRLRSSCTPNYPAMADVMYPWAPFILSDHTVQSRPGDLLPTRNKMLHHIWTAYLSAFTLWASATLSCRVFRPSALTGQLLEELKDRDDLLYRSRPKPIALSTRLFIPSWPMKHSSGEMNGYQRAECVAVQYYESGWMRCRINIQPGMSESGDG